ncbi:MAG: DUF5689 domain-containing protein [Paludibacteraceae bacterium]|nr:DUF5689 domain-containing protein [Paludibacteraceae bacterium]
MKRITLFFVIALVSVVTLLSSCKNTVPDYEDMIYAEDEATIAQLTADGDVYNLNDFMDRFMTEEGNYLSDTTLYRTRATDSAIDGKYLFSMDTIPADGRGIYIMGRVTTDDYGGNFYKTLVIQQIVDNEQQALRISVDAGSVSGLYPRGQMLLIRCNGLAIGRYANQPQLCVPSYNNNVFADKANQKVGWAPGRIPLPRFKEATKYLGKPDEKKLVYDTRTIADITQSSDLVAARKEDGKLIRIENIHYSGQCLAEDKSLTYCTTGNPTTDKTANVFAPTTGNVGYPQSRVIFDAENTHYICVSMSEYAKQANFYIPGATSAEEADVFFYDSLAVTDLSKPYLLANLPNKPNCVIPVDSRKEYEGWQMDDVIYTSADKSTGYIYDGASWSTALGVLHCSEYAGSVKGILSYYMDNAAYEPESSNWAVSICDLSDLDLYKNGVKWTPLEYTPN